MLQELMNPLNHYTKEPNSWKVTIHDNPNTNSQAQEYNINRTEYLSP